MAQIDYEQIAERYDEDRERFLVPRDAVIEDLLIKDGPIRVLDLGCGTRRWLARQREVFGDSLLELTGVDLSSGMLSEGRAKGISSLVCADAEDLPLDDETVDYVFTSFAFHHFTNKERVLDEVTRLLRIGGIFRMINIEPTTAAGWWLYQFFPAAKEIDAARFWEPERISEALEKRGFTVDIELETSVEELDAVVALEDAERRVVSQLALLDDDAYERGLVALRQAAAAPGSELNTVSSLLHVTSTK